MARLITLLLSVGLLTSACDSYANTQQFNDDVDKMVRGKLPKDQPATPKGYSEQAPDDLWNVFVDSKMAECRERYGSMTEATNNCIRLETNQQYFSYWLKQYAGK